MAVTGTKIVQVRMELLTEDALRNIQGARARIAELKRDLQTLKNSGKENSDEFIAMEAELKSLNGTVRANQQVLQNDIRAMEEQGTSLNALRAELSNAKAAYASLGEEAKNSTQGINAQLRVEELQSQVKQLEQGIGDYTRNVGNYENAVKAALEGTMPLRAALKEVRNELGSLNFQYVAAGKAIAEQKAAVEQLAQTKGKESAEYQEASAKLQQMTTDYQNLGNTIREMTQVAGELDDTMKDTSASIANAGADAAQWQAAKQGAEVLLNSYTALHSSMVALGIESEELINVFAKLQILQQGLNAINSIAQALQKESILRQQLQVLWTNLTTKSLGTLIAAKKKDAVASVTATAATGALATGESVATATTGTLVGALEVLKTAIYNIPIIGWILAAVAALAALITWIVKANDESEEGIILQERASENLERQQAHYDEVDSKIIQIKDDLAQMNHILETSDKNSERYKDTIKKLGKEIGVDLENQKVDTKTLARLEEVHIKIKKAQLEQEFAQNQYLADRNKLQQINNVLSAAATLDHKDRAEFIKNELNMTEEQAADYAAAIHNGLDAHKTWQQALRDEGGATAASYDRLNKSVKDYEKNSQSYSDKVTELVAEMDALLDENGIKRVKTEKKTASATTDIYKQQLDERRKVEDQLLDMLEDSIEKQVAVYRTGINRQIEDLKHRLEVEKNLTSKARNDINRQITNLEEQRNKQLALMRDKYNREELAQMLKMQKERKQLLLKTVNSDSEAAMTLNLEFVRMEEEAQQLVLDNWKANEDNKLKFFEDINAQEANVRAATLKTMGMSEEEFNQRYEEAKVHQMTVDAEYTNRRLVNERYYQQQRENIEREFSDKKNNAQANADNTNAESDFSRRLNDVEVSNFRDKEVQKTQILLEQAQYREQIAQSEVDSLTALTQEQILQLYGTQEAYNEALAQANAKLIEQQGNVKIAMQESNAAILQQKKNTLDNSIAIGQAIGSMVSNIGDLFTTLAESNDKYNDFATGMAMAQIMISSAVSIAQAIQAAVQAGGFTGPAAAVTIPVFIAELVGIVASGVASAVSTLKKAKEAKQSVPKFATGGFVSEGQSGVDRVPAMLTLGEYVIRKPIVDKYGIDFFNSLNNGSIGLGTKGHYAQGGEVLNGIALSSKGIDYDLMKEMFAEAVSEVKPVVSVKEITNVQKRVEAKEKIAKR